MHLGCMFWALAARWLVPLLIWRLPADFRIFRIWLLFAASAFAVRGETGGTERILFTGSLVLILSEFGWVSACISVSLLAP